MIATVLRNEVFAGNRAIGTIRLAAAATDGITRRTRVHEAGSLRVRFPNVVGPDALDAVIVNTAGGMTGGDCFAIDVGVTAGGRLTVSTAAAEKIYRSLGADTKIDIALKVGNDSTLHWLPQETILFDQARLHRSIDVDLATDARLLLAEAAIFGRAAMGEKLQTGHLTDRWRVRRDGKLIFAETSRLDGAIAKQLDDCAVAAGGAAVAALIAVPGDDTILAALRSTAFAGETGISAWNGIAVARFVAADGATLRRDLTNVLTTLRGELPRSWLN
jgi:urease accessory protein